MELTLKNSTARRLAALLEVVLVVTSIVWISRTYFASRSGRRPNTPDLQSAVRLDPTNSEYQLLLGRLAQYNVTDMNPELALESFRRAAELNPRDPQPWLELAAAFGFLGKNDEAEACLRRADFLAPNLPAVQWVIGNFYLLRGDHDEAFRHFRIVLSESSQYSQTLFKIAWKATDDGQKILEELIPDRVITEIEYLYFLLSQKRFAEARSVWKRAAGHGEGLAAGRVAGYIDQLISAHLPAEALQVWDDLKNVGQIKPAYGPTAQNRIVNGDFEEDLLNLGFDWRIVAVEGIFAGLDGTNFHSPGRAMHIRFSGKENVGYRHVYQYVSVEPGRSYRLTGFLKTEGITTDSGPRLSVRDAYDPSVLHKFSESTTGSTAGWDQAILDFTAGPKTILLVVSVVRPASTKIDNRIAGRVWVDDLTLVANPLEGGQAR